MYLKNNSKEDKIISYICDCEYEYFLNKKNVVGVGLGYKVKNGFYSVYKCIKVFVTKKVSKNFLLKKDLIPSLYKGIKTDVIETGRFICGSLTGKIRPVTCGYVIGNDYNKEFSGTLGCLVTDGKELFILSNNHVIATSNNAPIGSKIIQPSFKYGGNFQSDVIGNLSKFIKVKFKTFFKRPNNYVDGAIGKVLDKSLVTPEIALIGFPMGIGSIKLNENVKKVGFKTELTTGKITSISSTFEMDFPIGKSAIFKKQILSTKMNQGGDSGAVVLDDSNYIIGLLMGNSINVSVINPISVVLKELNVIIITRNLWNYYKKINCK